ncbi:MAG: BatA domain-containing protein [Phycisphaerales bacterium]
MTFLHPSLALAGAAAIAIPIIIHLLFRQRRKPLPWAAMRFLLEALRKQRKRLRLETLILLAVRCLLLACLGAAIARPILSGAGLLGGSGSGRDVYLLVDNSIASALRSDTASDKTALTRHLESARAVADALTASDRLGVITLGGPADALVVPASPDARAAAALLDNLKPTDSAADLAGALERVAATVRSQRATQSSGVSRPVALYLFSDLYSGSADLSRPLPAAFQGTALENISLIAVAPNTTAAPNVQIVALEPLRGVVLSGGASSGGTQAGEPASQVRVTLRRTGAAVSTASVSTVRVSTSLSGSIAPTASSATVRWSPGQSSAVVTVQLEADTAVGASTESANAGGSASGREAVLVAELDRDALASDNVRRRPIEVRDRLQVGVIAQRAFGGSGRPDQLSSAEWFRLALRPGESSPVEIIDIEPAAVDAPALASLDAIILPAPDLLKDDAWQRVRRFAEGGGLVIVSPPESVTVHLWADAFTKALGLNWTIAREAAVAAPDAPARIAEPAQGLVPGAGSDGGTIFALLAQELQQLARPVTITRWLNVSIAPAAAATDAAPRTTTAGVGNGQSLLTLASGQPWLIAARMGAVEPAASASTTTPSTTAASAPAASTAGRGLVVMLASAPVLAWTDLPARPLMVPLVQELIRQGVGEAGDTLTALAGRPVGLPGGTFELRAPTGSTGTIGERIPVADAGNLTTPVRAAGVWRATDNAGRSRGTIVVNPDPDGATLDPQSPDAVRAWLSAAMGSSASIGAADTGTAGGAVSFIDPNATDLAAAQSQNTGKSAWTLPLFIAALVLAMIELALARWFSHATVERAAPSGPRAPSLDDLLAGPAATPTAGGAA